MKAVVVFESLWGNTEAVARAIAEGIGPEAQVLTTDQATAAVVADAELIVAGAPVQGFRLGTVGIRAKLSADPGKAPTPPDLNHPSMRTWLAALPQGHGRASAFETRIAWSPGGATGTIMRSLERAGYPRAAKPASFVVSGMYGPLRDGELARARAWGAELAQGMA